MGAKPKRKPQVKRAPAKKRRTARRPAPNAGAADEENATPDPVVPYNGSWLPDFEIGDEWGNQDLGPHFN